MARHPHFVVTTDLSEDSYAAFAPAAALARKTGAKLTLVTVVQDLPAIPHGAPLAPPQSEPGVPRRKGEAEERLAKLLDQFPAGAGSRVLVASDVSGAIADFAKETHATLLVIASHGWGGARGLLLGSTARSLLERSRMPALVVPAGTGPHDLGLS
jgi:nucleotide-binding universal stress UspA family protein